MGISKAQKVAILQSLPLFEAATKRELGAVAAVAVDTELPAGTVLTREGATGGLAYVVVDGTVVATRKGRAVGTLGPGSIVGELSLLDGGPRTATVTATDRVTVLELAAEDFRKVLDRSPAFAAGLLRALAGRLRETDRKIDLRD